MLLFTFFRKFAYLVSTLACIGCRVTACHMAKHPLFRSASEGINANVWI